MRLLPGDLCLIDTDRGHDSESLGKIAGIDGVKEPYSYSVPPHLRREIDDDACCNFLIEEPMLIIATHTTTDHRAWCMVLNHRGFGWLEESELRKA